MAISKSSKILAEMEKVKAKISEQQGKLKDLEQKYKEAQNEEIVDIVRSMNISIDDLPGLLQAMKNGTLRQSVPKSAPDKEVSE